MFGKEFWSSTVASVSVQAIYWLIAFSGRCCWVVHVVPLPNPSPFKKEKVPDPTNRLYGP